MVVYAKPQERRKEESEKDEKRGRSDQALFILDLKEGKL